MFPSIGAAPPPGGGARTAVVVMAAGRAFAGEDTVDAFPAASPSVFGDGGPKSQQGAHSPGQRPGIFDSVVLPGMGPHSFASDVASGIADTPSNTRTTHVLRNEFRPIASCPSSERTTNRKTR